MDERKYRSLFAARWETLTENRIRFDLWLRTPEEELRDDGPHGEYRVPDGEGPFTRPTRFDPWFVVMEVHPHTISVIDKHVDEGHLIHPWFIQRISELAEDYRRNLARAEAD